MRERRGSIIAQYGYAAVIFVEFFNTLPNAIRDMAVNITVATEAPSTPRTLGRDTEHCTPFVHWCRPMDVGEKTSTIKNAWSSPRTFEPWSRGYWEWNRSSLRTLG